MRLSLVKKNIVGKLPNHRNKRLAQTAIEFILGVIVLFIFFGGALKAFVWVNKTMIERQENYEKTRTLAGNNWLMQSDWQASDPDDDADDPSAQNEFHKWAKTKVTQEFYNKDSGGLGWVGMVTGAFNPADSHMHGYEPLKIFDEDK